MDNTGPLYNIPGAESKIDEDTSLYEIYRYLEEYSIKQKEQFDKLPEHIKREIKNIRFFDPIWYPDFNINEK